MKSVCRPSHAPDAPLTIDFAGGLDGAGGVGGIAEVEEELEDAAEFSTTEIEVGFGFDAAGDFESDREDGDQEREKDTEINDVKTPNPHAASLE